jgi:penicillin-binding protein 2
MTLFRRRKRISYADLQPNEVFVDSGNSSRFDTHLFEDRLERPISRGMIALMSIIFLLVGTGFAYRIYSLQVAHGEQYAEMSENNRLNHSYLFADRGIIYDRNGVPLAWNVPQGDNKDYSLRSYVKAEGFAHLLGYVKYPKKDKNGFYYDTEFSTVGGVEEHFNDRLHGAHGLRIVETNAVGEPQSENVIRPPVAGDSITLSVDWRLQDALHRAMREVSEEVGFKGGAGLLMDLETGELVAMTSYPEFNSQIMTDGDDEDAIQGFLQDPKNAFLDRAASGLYTPGSIVKPYLAFGALQEGLIGPNDRIVTNGRLVIPNPYNPDQPTYFNDWKNHGPVNVKEAIAVSSNVYFYVVGGGFESQAGLGIERINQYVRKFGFGVPLLDSYFGASSGTVPSLAWKAENFPDDPWRIGDTYFTSIGQYGFQATPAQVVRAVATIATRGDIVEPTVVKGGNEGVEWRHVEGIDDKWYDVIHEGMRLTTTMGTGKAMNVPEVEVAIKTGTAELGISKQKVNSWTTGFWPYKNPKYAFAIIMESGDRTNLVGASAVGRRFLDWIIVNAPEYLQ